MLALRQLNILNKKVNFIQVIFSELQTRDSSLLKTAQNMNNEE